MLRLRFGIFAAIAATLANPASRNAASTQEPVTASPESTLFILARTRSDMSADRLMEDFKLGLDKTVKEKACQYSHLEKPQPIPAATFEALASLLGDGGKPKPAASSDDIDWRQIPARETTWELRLAKPTQLLTELSVKYKKAGEFKYVSIKKKEGDQEFRMVLPGSYVIPMLADDIPEEYSAKIEELRSEPKEIKQKKFPEIDRFYSVTIRGFKGNQLRLFEVLSDPNVLPNPVLTLEPLKNYNFAFANLSDRTGIRGEPILEGQSYVARIGKIDGGRPARVWMMFPMSKQDVEAKIKEYEGKSRSEMSKLIREDKATVPFDKMETVDAKTIPRWFELPDLYAGPDDNRKYQAYGRNIPLSDFRALSDKFPQIYRLLLWEFDNGTDQFAIEVRNADGKRVNFLDEEIKALPGALQQVIKKKDTPPKP